MLGEYVFELTYNSGRHRRIIRVQSAAAQSVHTSIHARCHGPLFTRNARNNKVISTTGTRPDAADVCLHRILTQCITGQCERVASIVHCYYLNTYFNFHYIYRFLLKSLYVFLTLHVIIIIF